jgi:pimeloyl-ACP methyl ester carboxylesterase
MKYKVLLLSLFITHSFISSAQKKEHLIEMDGNKNYVVSYCLEKRERGQPVIVFESGLGTDLGNWYKLVDQLSTLAPLVTYDRPGIGKSQANDKLPTTTTVASHLRALLKQLGVAPPYLLVGHSLGGAYVRLHQSTLFIQY